MKRQESPLIRLALLVRDICQLRRGPEEIPYSARLLVVLIGASVVIDVLSERILGGHDALERSLVSTSLVLALCWIALAMRRLGNRYVQTATALVACSILFSLLVLPLAMLAGPLPNDATLTPLQTLLVWATFAIFVWSVLVDAHIIRRALDAPFGLGVALALAWTIADWALGHALFDAPG
ncbi:MAG TPA: hypothetical protein VFV97_16080 [Rhodanobacteraceae bacterium]|nr:hypothetical protein [Rhodanobacteraceae bacterium]